MLKKRGLSVTVVVEGQSLNYNESPLNVSELKKMYRGNGNVHTFASRQSFGYDIRRIGSEVFGWDLNVVTGKNRVVQFDPSKTIKDSVEMDLMGYMMTAEGKNNTKTRNAVVRLSNAISLEPYNGDLEFGTNMGLAQRIGNDTMPYTQEQHKSYYAYTFTIELDRVGIDGDIELSNEDKYERVSQFLSIIRHLNRDIRGRRENLAPLFVIGGIYSTPNPYFQDRVELVGNKKGFNLNTNMLNSILNSKELSKDGDLIVGDSTFVGYVDGKFANISDLECGLHKDRLVSIDGFFDALKDGLKPIYGVK